MQMRIKNNQLQLDIEAHTFVTMVLNCSFK